MKESPTILVVDDEPINILLLEKILKINKYNVLTARSGMEALKILENTKPDLVLLDLLMPGIDGFEVLHIIRENNTFASMPVVIVTALSDKQYKDRAFTSGASGYITKPILPQRIVEIVEEHINKDCSVN